MFMQMHAKMGRCRKGRFTIFYFRRNRKYFYSERKRTIKGEPNCPEEREGWKREGLWRGNGMGEGRKRRGP